MNIFVILALGSTVCTGKFQENSVLIDNKWENVIFGGFRLPKQVLSPDFTEPRIIGGETAIPHAFPYQVSLQIVVGTSRYHTCGGSILSPTKIACAAHCCAGQDVSDLVIVAGAQNMKINELDQQRVGVSKLIIHPDNNPKTVDNDACKIILAQALELNLKVAAIPLCPIEPPADTLCTATGWGLTDNLPGSVTLPDALQAVSLKIIPRRNCIKDYEAVNPVTRSMLCAGGVEEQGGCNGDSGGPLKCTVNEQDCLAGCTSWGVKPCAQLKYPTVYANVANLISFYNSD